jgi:uncharacterized membrane protein HdeD (DUF308 family)
MADMLARNWWSLALRGVLAIIFGILAWVWPEVTLTSLVLLFGAYLLVDGVVNIVAAARGRTAKPRWFPVVMGIAEIIIGLVTLLLPGVTAMALVFLIAAWAVTMGAFAIIAAISLRRDIDGEWLLALYGILSILFGLAIAIFPGAGAIALIWLIGTFAVVDGILLLSLAFHLRNWAPLGRDVRTAESTNTAAAA